MQESAEDIARHFEDLKAAGKELEGLVPVSARVKPNADTVYSTRYSKDEIALIREAARQRKMRPSAFIRSAALAAAAGDLDLAAGSRVVALTSIREKARDLYNAVSEL